MAAKPPEEESSETASHRRDENERVHGDAVVGKEGEGGGRASW